MAIITAIRWTETVMHHWNGPSTSVRYLPSEHIKYYKKKQLLSVSSLWLRHTTLTGMLRRKQKKIVSRRSFSVYLLSAVFIFIWLGEQYPLILHWVYFNADHKFIFLLLRLALLCLSVLPAVPVLPLPPRLPGLTVLLAAAGVRGGEGRGEEGELAPELALAHHLHQGQPGHVHRAEDGRRGEAVQPLLPHLWSQLAGRG